MKVTITSRFTVVTKILLWDLGLIQSGDEPDYRREGGRDMIILTLPAERRNQAGDFAAFAGYAQPIKLIDDLKIEMD